jgi:septin family protein
MGRKDHIVPYTLETSNPFNVEYPAGKFFVGRESQLRQLRELLHSLLRGVPTNLFVVGKGGEGKTTYLEKIVEEAQKRGMLACKVGADIGKSAEKDIDTIIRAMLRELEKITGQEELENDWASGDKSTYRTPRINEVQSEELAQGCL